MAKTAINNRGSSASKQKNGNKNKPKSRANRQKQSQSIDLKHYSIQQLYDMAEQFYQKSKNQAQDDKWNSFITQKGTKKDKITFVASEILKRPESSLEQFQLLAKWCMDVNHNFALPACQALNNIYTEHIFIEKPSLKVFLDSVQEYIKQHKKDSAVEEGDLIGFYLEHKIKHFYGELIRGVTELLTSSITHVKKTSIQILANLTRFKELRRTILATLINKFGDQDMDVVNEVTKSLKSQFYEDVQASEILLEEAETFLFRENLSQKSQFYVVNFLNNVNLKFFSEKSLTKLFDLFFHFFTKLMDKDNDAQKKSISSRLFLNSIKGLNKIFAFMKSGNKQTKSAIEEKVEIVYKTFHKTTNTKAKVQLLLFLFQSCTHIKGSITDRFYRVLYEFLGTNEIIHCSIAEMFFDLLMLSLKEDQNLNRNIAFVKRILQLCFEAQSNFIVTCLILVGKIIMEKPALQIMLKQRENALSQGDDADVTEDLNRVISAVKNEKLENINVEKSLPYDMNKRQPIYCGAEKTNIWELTVLKNHYHPTVRKFTQHILANEEIPYSGANPLLELSLTSFIEKLSLRKEKKSDSWRLKVKRNLSKIRSSKYESILQKPLQSFEENEDFIKKYLQKRQNIHMNKKAMQGDVDLEDFADCVIEKELDRLQAKQDNLEDDLSISQQDLSDPMSEDELGQLLEEEQLQKERLREKAKGNEQGLSEEMNDDFEDGEFGSDEDLDEEMQDEDAQQFGDDGFNDSEGEFLDGARDYNENSDMMSDEEAEFSDEEDQEGSKEFEDVFDDINDEKEYIGSSKKRGKSQMRFNNSKKNKKRASSGMPSKSKKPITKANKGKNFKRKGGR